MNPNKNGVFTLIELIVVVSVISILLVMLLAALETVKMKEKMIACKDNLRQNIVGMSMYAGDNNNYLTPFKRQHGAAKPIPSNPKRSYGTSSKFDESASSGIYDYRRKRWIYVGLLYDGNYIADYKTLFCPSATGKHSLDSYNEGESYSGGYKQRVIQHEGSSSAKALGARDFIYEGRDTMIVKQSVMYNRVILSDLIDNQQKNVDLEPNCAHATKGINLLYGDGHVGVDSSGQWLFRNKTILSPWESFSRKGYNKGNADGTWDLE